jgi:hypothetical protein
MYEGSVLATRPRRLVDSDLNLIAEREIYLLVTIEITITLKYSSKLL